MTTDLIPLPGSERAALAEAEAAGTLAAEERLDLTLVLRRRSELPTELVEGDETIDREQLAARYGADPADVQRVTDVLTAHGLDVIPTDPGTRRVVVSGPVSVLTEVFNTSVSRVRSVDPFGASVVHRHREGSLHLPAELDGIVVAVLGMDDRPQTRAQFRLAAAEGGASYTPVQVGQAYSFPDGTDGTGQTLAIIELGGGYADSDLKSYFAKLNLQPPNVRAVGVDGGKNSPGKDPSGADGEVLLDIEVAGALAPKASIVVYFAPNTDQGFLDAVTTAVHAHPTPTAVSISWGGPESSWTAQSRGSFDKIFEDAAALGVTVCTAAGDGGSSDGQSDGKPHVDFPSASPHVLACGGTKLSIEGSKVSGETVWNDGSGKGATGGGVSTAFGLPNWQKNTGVPERPGGGTGRGVPDVAGDADPATGYQVLVDGQSQVIGGTSAVAPLWAALVCRLAQGAQRKLGLLQPSVYDGKKPAGDGTFRDITDGSNGDYDAGDGWDACTGLGSPNGTALLSLLKRKSG